MNIQRQTKQKSLLTKYLSIKITDQRAVDFQESVRFNDDIIVSEEKRRLYRSPFELLYYVFINFLSKELKGNREKVIVAPFFDDAVIIEVDSKEMILKVFISRGNKNRCATIKRKYLTGELSWEMDCLTELSADISTVAQMINCNWDYEYFKANRGDTYYG